MKNMIQAVKQWSPETKKKVAYAAAGVAVAVGSAIAVVDYMNRRRKERRSNVAELIAGIAGIAAGIAIATEPKREEKRVLVMDDLFDDDEIQLIYQQIKETLDSQVDGEECSKDHLRTIEVDDDATIEDFI